MTAPTRDTITLYFTATTQPWSLAGLQAWFLRRLIGTPTHVTVAVAGVAFMVSPGKLGCWQVPASHYAATAAIEATVILPCPNPHEAFGAAWTYAVGPCTYRQTIRRWLTGKAEMCDLDCVGAACIVLGRAGYQPPPCRTPKELLAWLKSLPAAKNSTN